MSLSQSPKSIFNLILKKLYYDTIPLICLVSVIQNTEIRAQTKYMFEIYIEKIMKENHN